MLLSRVARHLARAAPPTSPLATIMLITWTKVSETTLVIPDLDALAHGKFSYLTHGVPDVTARSSRTAKYTGAARTDFQPLVTPQTRFPSYLPPPAVSFTKGA